MYSLVISSNYSLKIIFFLFLFKINVVMIHLTSDKPFPVLASLPLAVSVYVWIEKLIPGGGKGVWLRCIWYKGEWDEGVKSSGCTCHKERWSQLVSFAEIQVYSPIPILGILPRGECTPHALPRRVTTASPPLPQASLHPLQGFLSPHFAMQLSTQLEMFHCCPTPLQTCWYLLLALPSVPVYLTGALVFLWLQ